MFSEKNALTVEKRQKNCFKIILKEKNKFIAMFCRE
jgi:hypothetical protein